MIVAGSNSQGMAAIISRELNEKLVMIERKIFPDGELYVRISSEPEERAIVVQSLTPPQDRSLMELFLIVDSLKGLNVNDIIAVIPYLAYARQDKRFLTGEPITLKVVLDTLRGLGVSKVLTVDVHNEKQFKKFMGDNGINILPTEIIAEYFKDRLSSNSIVLAPDKGALWRAKSVAEKLGLRYDYIEKKRDRTTGEIKALPKELDVSDKDVLIVDDIISTGRTIALAARNLKEKNAKKIYVACTHAVLVENALDRIYQNGVLEVVATDTLPSPISKLSIAPLLVRYLKQCLSKI